MTELQTEQRLVRVPTGPWVVDPATPTETNIFGARTSSWGEAFDDG